MWKNKFPDYVCRRNPTISLEGHLTLCLKRAIRFAKDPESLNMLAIDLTLNIFVLAGIVFFSLILGTLIRYRQIASLKKKIAELEKEMLGNHADILVLQKEKAVLEHRLQESKIPVIPLNVKEEAEKKPDVARRK